MQLDDLRQKAAEQIGRQIPKDWVVDQLKVSYCSIRHVGQAILYGHVNSQRLDDPVKGIGKQSLLTFDELDRVLSEPDGLEKFFAKTNLERQRCS